MQCRGHDLVFLQRNLTATLATWEWLIGPPFVFDVDDAIFIGARGESAGRIAKRARLTICGNSFLADYFSTFGPVAVVPTAVDTKIFCPGKRQREQPVIGWSGSSSGFEYLYEIEDALDEVLRRVRGATLKVVSDQPPRFRSLDPDRVVFERWSVGRQVSTLQEFSVGIMPLTDSLWARGKCSYKMLTYMAAGVPVVVSPVGMNLEVLERGLCGYSASTLTDWVDALTTLLADPGLSQGLGERGREIVEMHYSRNVIAPRLISLLGQQL